jgi:hypothetical protein
MSEEKKEKLLNALNDLPNELFDELIDFAEYLKIKNSKKTEFNFKNVAEFVIKRDEELLKQLAK